MCAALHSSAMLIMWNCYQLTSLKRPVNSGSFDPGSELELEFEILAMDSRFGSVDRFVTPWIIVRGQKVKFRVNLIYQSL